MLFKYTKKLIFCFDGDNAGRQAALRAFESATSFLNQGLDINFIFLPDGHDPDSFIRKEGKELFLTYIKAAKTGHQYILNVIAQKIDYSSLSGKSQLIHALKPYLSKIGPGPYQQLFIHELTRLTHLDANRLEELLCEEEPQKRINPNKLKKTPQRIAISILLQHPEIYHAFNTKIDASLLDSKKHYVLKKLMEQIAKCPNMSSGHLLELWRESKAFDSLTELLSWEHCMTQEALVKEFIDIIFFLVKKTHHDQIEDLMTKARESGLSSEERTLLQTLLQQKHSTTFI